jgi:predicted ATP-grasp superfamily ATP-dependent carboligase
MHVVIVGLSTRAAAESAARAGLRVTAIDAFADVDQHPAAQAQAVPRHIGGDRWRRAVTRAARRTSADAVAYLSPFENHPDLVAQLARHTQLLGATPQTLRRVRDPVLVMQAFRRQGLPTPVVIPGAANDPNDPNDPNPPSPLRGFGEAGEYLLKPLASGGGSSVRPWRRGESIPEGYYVQQFIEGTPGSVVFVAARGRAVPIGVSRQLVGEAAFGATGYRYCGSILARGDAGVFDQADGLLPRAFALATAAAAEFELVGINGIDFVAHGAVPVPIEINPRWSASIDLVERAGAGPVFGAHLDACTTGILPPRPQLPAAVIGKAIVFARCDAIVRDNGAWLLDPDVRDVPRTGEHMRAGQPVCTVYAQADTMAACRAGLVARADRVYAALAPHL